MKNVVITGANRGIGLELARHYCQLDYTVIGICRSSSEELDELADMVISDIDVRSKDSINMVANVLAETLISSDSGQKIDVLINNAGVFMNETLDELGFDSIQTQFEINAIAPLRLTHALQSLLWEGSKVAMITSRMGSVSDNESGGYYGYRASKAALNAFGKSLAIDLKAKGIAIALLHPGFVQTRMVGFNGDISPQQAASGLAQRIEELSLGTSGSFWHSNGEVLPW
ncbi:MAG: SDR family oxidoreductase [Oleispira sp.]|nr:SDR family oxidoreductase [Oleispira sp.]